MGEEAAAARYEPGTAFEEVKDEAMLDISPTDSKEFWLIQWIKDKDFDVSNFHGKKISLELQKDGNLGSLESSSGTSYDLVSFAYQQPNATVFLPSGSETKAVGKISRRVCLCRDREYDELKRPSFESLTPTPSSKISADSSRKTLEQKKKPSCGTALAVKKKVSKKFSNSSRKTLEQKKEPSSGNALAVKKKASKKRKKKKDVSHLIAALSSKNCNSQGSVGAMSMEQAPEHNKQRQDEGKASEGPHTRRNAAIEMPQTTQKKPPEMKK